MKNPVVKKYVFRIEMQLASPLCISNGDGELTDNDVLRDNEGIPFIPGSSLAGAMRSYLDADSNVKCIFGNAETAYGKNDDRMSSVFLSDFYFDDVCVTTVRDSVCLTKDKTAVTGAKFDMEVIDTGICGAFYIELVIRQNDDEQEMIDSLKKIFFGLEHHEIRFGHKKTRGYGEVKLLSVKVRVYTKENILDYAKAYQKENYGQVSDVKAEWISGLHVKKYHTLRIPVELDGCISIRQYAAKKNLPDYVHITANGKAVIPGTSMTGAVRHRISDLLRLDMGIAPDRYLNEMFGYVEKGSNNAKRSLVVVSEAVLEGSKPVEIRRNGISRFESGAKDGALYQERAYQGGKTAVEIRILDNENVEAMVGLLLLAMKDLTHGFLSVGGQTSVGKGIFHSDGEIALNGETVDDKKYLSVAAKWIKGGARS